MLEITSLSYQIDHRCLIRGVSLQFEGGKIHFVIGPNGSGKSTLLKSISGIWKPSGGEIRWCGQSLIDLPRRQLSQLVTYVPQGLSNHFGFTAEEVVEMGLYAFSTGEGKSRDRIDAALEETDLLELRHRPLTQLSIGERQRVLIARALVSHAPILLFDESMANLDIARQLEMWELLERHAGRGRCIIVVHHDLKTAQHRADHLALLHAGCLVYSGRADGPHWKSCVEEVFGVTQNDLGDYTLPRSIKEPSQRTESEMIVSNSARAADSDSVWKRLFYSETAKSGKKD